MEVEMPTPESDLQGLLLGALLHDVGKLYQRSGRPHSTGYGSFTPEDYGAHGAHAKWSADFVERQVSPDQPVRPHDILTHHLPIPSSRTARLIALADRLAAGEREARDGVDSRPPWESQLIPVFSRLDSGRDRADSEACYPLVPLELEREVIFPLKRPLPAEECRRGYLALWEGFEAGFSHLRGRPFEPYLEGAYHLLQRFGWCVPSAAYRQTPDVSLFDHSRLTCAIAGCLQLDDPPEERLEALLAWPPRSERQEELMLLVGGDISGLQGFLYTIAAGGAAKTLRGRSFYLTLLAESAARLLLRRIGLFSPNAIYWGGGHFYLLAPLSARDALESAAAEIEEIMLRLHGGDLGLSVAWVPLAASDFQGPGFASRWGSLGEELGRVKSRRFGRVIHRSYDSLFAPAGSGGMGQRCEACRVEVAGPEVEEPRCPTCEGMVELGAQVAQVGTGLEPLLSVSQEKPVGPLSWWQEALGGFGCWWQFGPGAADSLRYSLNRPDFTAAGADGFRWVPSVVPLVQEGRRRRTKEFTEIAADAIGTANLGVLRMDVDNLGHLFASGLGDRATASRVAALSSSLRLFFEGWINRLCEEVESSGEMEPPSAGRRSGLLYAVYSSGDDLFILGAWDRMPLLARRVRSDLERFAAGSPAVTISAGIALVDSHLPIHQSAGMAGDALNEGAKRFGRRDGRNKDALSMLGETLGWEEFDGLRGEVERLARLVSWGAGERVPRSLLSLLRQLHALYRQERERQRPSEGIPDEERLYYGRWSWMAAYALGRARERARSQEARDELAALERQLAEPGAMRRLGLVARWAEYLTRSKEVSRG
jgi:CRISPR-associated protein Csm1